MLKTYLFTVLILSSFSPFAQENTHWILAKQEAGIQVYTRHISGSDYKEFKGEVTLNAPLKDLLSFIKQTKQCSWQYKCLTTLNLTEHYIYKLSELPWPLSNRYTVMHSNETQDEKNQTYTIELKNIPRDLLPKAIQAQLPRPDNTIQMRHSDGYWKFDLKQAPIIHITHQMHGDPDGIIPASLANLGVINAAFVTLQGLKQHFNPAHEKPKYPAVQQ